MTYRPSTTLWATLALTFVVGLGAVGCTKAKAKIKGVGDNLEAFIVTNLETEERTCLVCAYGGRPTIMAVGDLDDVGFQEDLKQIQGLVTAHAKDDLTAFALYGRVKDGKFTPLADQAAAQAKLAGLQKSLGLSFPITLVPTSLTEKEKDYTPFSDSYDIAKSRTIMLADAGNKVVFSDVFGKSEAQYQALADAVKKL